MAVDVCAVGPRLGRIKGADSSVRRKQRRGKASNGTIYRRLSLPGGRPDYQPRKPGRSGTEASRGRSRRRPKSRKLEKKAPKTDSGGSPRQRDRGKEMDAEISGGFCVPPG
ncbi:high mobility group nucleosome-binding domain-containing protein 3 isoform X2 [Ornithorhynchus anatinus]|uniref:high mobility group nucleosome-binding domain-containing protein 3 isoform X2 n=1 Tax=Ornithorhynchus anatinus TaxID=9258 RepID=UPI0019D4C860|nr:high mobility group nucleosome-binding domain-containing protein 3 isoform X2 [Ornithorhynchus anatinus]